MDFNYCDIKLPYSIFSSFIEEVDQDFIPPLLNRINIIDFYNKVNSLANLVGCYYNKELIGLCVFYANNHDTQKAYITFLAVKKNFRGKNIAGEILKVACANAKKLGMNNVGIHTNNIIAKECYIKNGFILKDSFFEEKYNVIRYYLEKSL